METVSTIAGTGKAGTRKPSTVPITFRVSSKLKQELFAKAQVLGVSLSEYVETILQKGLIQQQVQPQPQPQPKAPVAQPPKTEEVKPVGYALVILDKEEYTLLKSIQDKRRADGDPISYKQLLFDAAYNSFHWDHFYRRCENRNGYDISHIKHVLYGQS